MTNEEWDYAMSAHETITGLREATQELSELRQRVREVARQILNDLTMYALMDGSDDIPGKRAMDYYAQLIEI